MITESHSIASLNEKVYIYIYKSVQARQDALQNSKDESKRLSLPKEFNIAKVVAAHAKFRWMNMTSNFKVKVDDISVVVIGFP